MRLQLARRWAIFKRRWRPRDRCMCAILRSQWGLILGCERIRDALSRYRDTLDAIRRTPGTEGGEG